MTIPRDVYRHWPLDQTGRPLEHRLTRYLSLQACAPPRLSFPRIRTGDAVLAFGTGVRSEHATSSVAALFPAEQDEPNPSSRASLRDSRTKRQPGHPGGEFDATHRDVIIAPAARPACFQRSRDAARSGANDLPRDMRRNRAWASDRSASCRSPPASACRRAAPVPHVTGGERAAPQPQRMADRFARGEPK